MTVLGRGLVFQPVLVTHICTYNSNNIITLQNIDITDFPCKKKKITYRPHLPSPPAPPPQGHYTSTNDSLEAPVPHYRTGPKDTVQAQRTRYRPKGHGTNPNDTVHAQRTRYKLKGHGTGQEDTVPAQRTRCRHKGHGKGPKDTVQAQRTRYRHKGHGTGTKDTVQAQRTRYRPKGHGTGPKDRVQAQRTQHKADGQLEQRRCSTAPTVWWRLSDPAAKTSFSPAVRENRRRTVCSASL